MFITQLQAGNILRVTLIFRATATAVREMLFNNIKAFRLSIFLIKLSIRLAQFCSTSSKQLTRTFLLPSSLPASSVFPLNIRTKRETGLRI